VVALAAGLLMGFRGIFSLDEDVARMQGVDYIPQKPIMRWIEPLFMLFGSGLIVNGARSFSVDDNEWLWLILFGIAFSAITGFASNTHLWLDEQGMHYRSGVGSVQTIDWKSLDHYEVRSVSDSEGVTYYYDFYSDSGGSISISKSSYNMDSLLAKVAAHADVPERPYKKKSWFS
jgi:hypothetical protein